MEREKEKLDKTEERDNNKERLREQIKRKG
jgi:hypothetical protein